MAIRVHRSNRRRPTRVFSLVLVIAATAGGGLSCSVPSGLTDALGGGPDGGNGDVVAGDTATSQQVMSVEPAELVFEPTVSDRTLALRNNADQPLSCLLTTDADWLTTDVATVTLDATTAWVHVRVDRAGLSDGVHAATLQISVSDITAVDVPVLVYVGELPAVTDGAQLGVSTAELDFALDKSALAFMVRNEGAGVLYFAATAIVPWIKLTDAEGTSSGEYRTVRVDVDRNGLAPGPYGAYIVVNSVNEEATVHVSLTVPDADDAALEVTPTELDFGTSQTQHAILVRSAGDGELTYTVTPDVEWAVAAPSAGTSAGEYDTVRVNADRAGRAPGEYSGKLVVRTGGGVSRMVSLRMTVSSDAPGQAPMLELSTNLLNFGTESSELSFAVRNAGGGTLAYTIVDNADWVSVAPTAGGSTGEHDLIRVQIQRRALPEGQNLATVTVLSSTGQFADVAIVVEQPGLGGGSGVSLVPWPTSDSRLDYHWQLNGATYDPAKWVATPLIALVQIPRSVENYEQVYVDTLAVVKELAPHAVYGTYISGNDCRKLAQMNRYPNERIAYENFAPSDFIYGYEEVKQSAMLNLVNATAARQLADLIVAEISQRDTQFVYLDNMRHPHTGAFGPAGVTWPMVISHLTYIRDQLHAVGIRTVANIAVIPWYVAGTDTDMLIGAVDGVSLEMPFHQNHVRPYPERIAIEFGVYRQWLDAGLQIQLVPWFNPGGDPYDYDQNRFMAGMVLMFREPGDSIFVKRDPWNYSPDWVDWPARLGVALGDCTISADSPPVLQREFEYGTVTVDVGASLNADTAPNAVTITWR